MTIKICKFCHEFPAKHLDAVESGPVFGLALEHGSDDFCSVECWEASLHVANKIAEVD